MTKWKYPINDLRCFAQKNYETLSSSVERVLRSGWYVLGSEVEKFENNFSSYIGSNHCVSVANGTDAIEIALRACGVSKGNLVATAANAGMYSTTALNAVGAEPLYIDVCKDSHCITAETVKYAIEHGVSAVIATHLYGRITPDIRLIQEQCKQNGIPLIEDCAQAHGASINGVMAGNFGDASTFSFYPTKNLGCLGDGGAIVTSSSSIMEKSRTLRQYGWSSKYQVTTPNGRNSRLDEIQAAVLLDLLPLLDQRNATRQLIADTYSNCITHNLVSTPNSTGSSYVAHLYVLTTANRDSLRKHLESHGVQCEIHYPTADYNQPINQTKKAITLPVTEHLEKSILTIPCHPEMTIDMAKEISHFVNSWQAVNDLTET